MLKPSSSSPEPLKYPDSASGYMVRHNNTIIGIFGSQEDANSAMHDYETQNNIELEDVLDILKVI